MKTPHLPGSVSRRGLFAFCRLSLAMVVCGNVAAATAMADYREAADGYPCGYPCALPRPGDEIYLVSTRCLSGGCGWTSAAESAQVWRYEVGAGWRAADWQELTTTASPSNWTSVYVHGNDMDRHWAERRGWEMYHELTRRLSLEQNVRHVIWSWPTEGRSLREVREHAQRADVEAYYLASYLATIPPTEQVSLSAFSLGARVVSGACHLMGGGALRGRALPQTQRNVHGYRVVYFSAGLTYSALCSSGLHGQALEVTDRLLNIYNSADKVLKFYHLATRRRGDQAAGYVGFYLASYQREKVRQVNAAHLLGREHSWDNLICNRCLMDEARGYLQWQEPQSLASTTRESVSAL